MSSHTVNDTEHPFDILRDADPALMPLMRRLRECLMSADLDLPALKAAMLAVLEFLCSAQGRTDENCSAVDMFLTVDDAGLSGRLPEAYHDILADMGGALHDTVTAPHIAENFDSTPEQLLARARTL